jgi:DNA-directed RNA polymerase sigma subunit (sigma70/sigma32)
MSASEPEDDLKEEQRRVIFRALVEAEDYQEMPRPQARRLIARRFGISEARVREIEREGMDRLWPPL